MRDSCCCENVMLCINHISTWFFFFFERHLLGSAGLCHPLLILGISWGSAEFSTWPHQWAAALAWKDCVLQERVRLVLLLSTEPLNKTRNQSHAFCLGFYKKKLYLCCRSGLWLCGVGLCWASLAAEMLWFAQGTLFSCPHTVSSAVWDAFGFRAGPSFRFGEAQVSCWSSVKAAVHLLHSLGLLGCWRLLFRRLSWGFSEADAQRESLTGGKHSFGPEVSPGTRAWSCDSRFTELLKHLMLNTWAL